MSWSKLFRKIGFGFITGGLPAAVATVNAIDTIGVGLFVAIANGIVNWLKHKDD